MNGWARACPSSLFPKPEIKVSPAIPGEVADTDAEELKVTQSVISGLNQNPAMGWSHSLVVIKAPRFAFYCMQERFTIVGTDFNHELTCHAPRLPYSFHYNGPPEYEKEAEAIFQSAQ
jgi:hypothetical protein